jgi:ATP dependent DNA ligase-like protein
MKPSPSLKKQLDSLPPRAVSFIEPMECLAVSKLHDGPQWVYEIKLDGYRALGIKSNGTVRLLSRRNNSFNRQYPLIVEALSDLPEDTVVDGEVVALDESGFPNLNRLQNYRTEATRIHFFIFDLPVYQGRDLTRLPLIERRDIMRSVLKFDSGRVRISDYIEASATDILHAVRKQGHHREKKAQLLRARKAERRMDKVSRELRTGISDRRLRPRPSWSRLHHRRILQGRRSRLRRPSAKRICAGLTASGIRKAALPGGPGVPVRQPARDTSFTLGRRIDR